MILWVIYAFMQFKNQYNSPKTNITGTLGGSNFTFPRFCIGKIPLAGVLIFAECCPPPPFQSVDSFVSWADVFASKISKR